MTDILRDILLTRGHDPDLVDEITERAAILQYDAGLERWRAGVEAQRQNLMGVEAYRHDI